MVKTAKHSVIATGDGENLERWGDIVLLRPDPQAIWKPPFPLATYPGISARYLRDSGGGGRWDIKKRLPDEWRISYGKANFWLKLMGFKHTGLFPEQAANWDVMTDLIKNANRPIRVLNLFGYTGGASVMCALAGAEVTHVDASKGMCERAGKTPAPAVLIPFATLWTIAPSLWREKSAVGRSTTVSLWTPRATAEDRAEKRGT